MDEISNTKDDNFDLDKEELCNEFLDAIMLLKEAALLFRQYETHHREMVKPIPDKESNTKWLINKANELILQRADIEADLSKRIEDFINKKGPGHEDSS